MTIGVYARSVKENHPDYIKTLSTILSREKINLLIEQNYYTFLKKQYDFNLDVTTFDGYADVKSKVDIIISLGGDGTILETLDFVRDSGTPVLGVNTGRLGFLASVYKEDFSDAINQLLEGKYKLDKRDIIKLESEKKIFGDFYYALNELTIMKKDSSSMITIDATVNDSFLNSYWADGLIVATPTGSTAYSLSCGGPILVPSSQSFVITPIAPHNLNVRPVIIPNECSIKLQVKGRAQEYLISLDSRMAFIDSGMEISLSKADFTFNLIDLDSQDFFNTLRNKLLWGIDKRN